MFFKRSYKKHYFNLVCKTRKKNERNKCQCEIKQDMRP